MFNIFKRKKRILPEITTSSVSIRNKSKINYSSWESSIFKEILDNSEETSKKVLEEYELLNDEDLTIIKSMGFNNNANEYSYDTLKRLKGVIDDGGILVKRDVINKITRDYRMNFVESYNFRGRLESTNIKEIVNLKKDIDKWSAEFKYYAKNTHNAPPTATWYEINASEYKSYTSIKDYKKEPILYVLERENSDKFVFVSLIRNDLYLPISYIKSERKSKIDDVLEEK